MTTALTAHPFSVSSARPPPGFLQLPWAPAPDAAWTFDGVHDWNEAEGSGPMASIDFFRLNTARAAAAARTCWSGASRSRRG